MWKKHIIHTVLLKTPLLTRTPGGDIKYQLGCLRVRINLSGVEFLVDLVVLKSKGIDVILGMDWLSRHNGLIGCTDKVVHLTKPEGVRVTCHTRVSGSDPMVFSMEAKSLEEVPVINEYPDVFPEELPGMPPDRDIDFVIDLVPGTAPIAKRPYRMAASELAELKKATGRIATNWLHQTKLVALGIPSPVCQEERWEYEVVCWTTGR